jgi:hypothetical protein
MFSKLKTIIKCYMCGDDKHRMTKCQKCGKIICKECQDVVFIGPGKECFWCKSKECKK